MISAFKTFYVIAPGGDPNFSTYVTEIVARHLGDDFNKRLPESSAKYTGPLFFVAAPSWTQDTFNAACQADPNVAGSLMIEYSNFTVDENWIVYNTESEHVTPILSLLDCNGDQNRQGRFITPPLKLFTVQSKHETTIPVPPLAAAGSLLTYNGNKNGGAVEASATVLLLSTIVSGYSGNVGYLNQGHEALSAAYEVGKDARAFMNLVCTGAPPTDAPGLEPSTGADVDIRKRQIEAIADLRKREDEYVLPTPLPSSPPTAAVVIVARAVATPRTVYAPSIATPTPAPVVPSQPPQPIPIHTGPITNLCTTIGAPAPPAISKP